MRRPPPIFARVFRGECVESVHRGALAVMDESGNLLARAGDPGQPVFVRSAAKPFQALPLLEGGGAERFRLGDGEIALLCASHGGEPRHVAAARRLLSRGGFDLRDLACGPHLPMHTPSAERMLRRGERPTPLHNNCSGKHAGLLLACRLLGLAARGYWKPEHPLQKRILERFGAYASVPPSSIGIAVDGCNLPVFRLPLGSLALAFARLFARRPEGEGREAEAARLTVLRAMTSRPEMVAGAERFTTDFLRAGRGAWIGKEGAEGIYGMALAPPHGGDRAVGIAFKIEDGSSRARDAVALEVLDRLGRLGQRARTSLERYRAPRVLNTRGREVGRIEAEVLIIARSGTGG
jgi:L-asparaginase II